MDLVERARAGDSEAFGSLAATRIDRLFAIAVRILHDRQDAEDAVQSALTEAWRDLRSLREADRFDAWLYRLLVRSCYEQADRKRRHAAGVTLLRVETATADASTALSDRDRIERAFQQLPINQRAVVVLHHFRGLPLSEVADALGIAEGTARSRLHYALKTMRAAIESDERQVVPGGQIA